ncbi:hypothetical protein PVAND_002003 [Polypedilum vanderplanki]|uniref:peptidylprolyl isomerase n=1 Tax=Polypedilum vanderplanki TaxID=319348 RepID=A0A9J6BPP1_POLVA|nr:hypothetical protein PVAND_002003 [Polypedilum vanderplanki]
MSKSRCFFDVTISNADCGRIVFELFSDICPKTCENFRQLCTGEAGNGKLSQKPLYYKGIIFHRVVKNFMVQSGDFVNFNGTGGESIYGKTFEDENFTLKHDKPFLLSMANRGKDTNSSQFFITTAPASHLDGIHTVFGRVVSGMDVVKQIENLPVDRNSRPLDEAKVKACGELVKQVKDKKEKKKKKKAAKSDSSESESDSSSDSSSSSEEEKRKKKKKHKKKSKKASKKKDDDSSSIEEGELKSDTEAINPMVSVTKIDPKEIPEVNNKFLMRAERPRDNDGDDNNGYEKRRRDSDRGGERTFGWSKKRVPQSRSGRVIKGRGNFRYRTPVRSRSRSFTPEHWKAAQRKLIKMSEFEKMEEKKKEKEDEIKRRAEERKRRHEAIAKGDGKKSFFELNQEITVAPVNVVAPEISKEPTDKTINDELDYEADEAEEIDEKKKDEVIKKDRDDKFKSERVKNRSRSRSRSRDFDRHNRDRDNRRNRRDFRDRRVFDDRNRNRFDRFTRRDDRDRYNRRRSRSRSRSRNNNRRRSNERRFSKSPRKSTNDDRKSKRDEKEKSPKIDINEKEIDELQRKVFEAKRVLEIMVKEKEEEMQRDEKKKRSKSRSVSDRRQRRSKKYSDSSD